MRVLKTFAVAVALTALAAGSAAATPINYTFDAGAYLVGPHGIHDLITGSFTFDPVTDTESNVDITINGTDYIQASLSLAGGDAIVTCSNGNLNKCSRSLTIDFVDDLGATADALSSVQFGAKGLDGAVGDAVPAVPEPAGWAILLFGLGALGFLTRRARRTFAIARV